MSEFKLKIIHPKINYDYQQKQEFIDKQIEQAKTQFRNLGLDFEIIEKSKLLCYNIF